MFLLLHRHLENQMYLEYQANLELLLLLHLRHRLRLLLSHQNH
jgi:hypothetical protein